MLEKANDKTREGQRRKQIIGKNYWTTEMKLEEKEGRVNVSKG